MHRILLTSTALLACLALAPRARAADPVFRVTPDTVRADPTGRWRLRPGLQNVRGRGVEMAILPADSALRPAPAVLFVPRSGTPARSLLRWALVPRARGSTIALVSLPGSGRTSGGPDRAGPASAAAVEA